MKLILTESQFKKLVETRVVGGYKDYQPIKDTDKIRVYHGFSSYSVSYALHCLVNGISGQIRAKRIYSYESGNNPKGLFVSTNFDVVKRNFANSGIIIEFDTNVTNLEAPVWKGQDSYFVQGQYTQSFRDDEERNQEILRKREKYKIDDPEKDYAKNRISKSDRPELADSIFNNSERQALFIGNLNPNEIKNVWFNEGYFYRRRTDEPWVRYSRKEFLRKYGHELKNSKIPEEMDNKIFKPNDDFSMEKLEQRANEEGWPMDTLLDLLKNDDYYQNMFLYPKQIKQFLAQVSDNN